MGKSKLTVWMTGHEFRGDYDPLIEDSYLCDINVRGKNEQVDILDTCGRKHFPALMEHRMREGDHFMLVYSINSQRTFEYTKNYIKN